MSLLRQIKENYHPPSPPRRHRGKQRDFSALSFLLLAVVVVVLRTYQDSELHKLLRRDGHWRETLGVVRGPHRTTIGRRLQAQVPEAQIAALGQHRLTDVECGEDASQSVPWMAG